MSNFSQPKDYLTTYSIDTNILNDTLVIGGGTGSNTFSITTGSTIDITSHNYTSSGTITIGNYDINSYTVDSYNYSKEFVNCLPNLDRIEQMCKEYPGLKIAFEKFKTTYYLVKDDYDTQKNQK